MKKKLLTILMLVLAVAFCAYGCGGNVSDEDVDKAIEESKTVTVDVVVNDQVQKTEEIVTDADNLGDMLRESGLAEGEQGSYGIFIKTVDGVAADEAKEEWWCVTKGGQAVQTGADSTPIADGDKFELTLKVGYDQ